MAITIVVAGAAGRMGKMVIQTITQDPEVTLVGALENPAHPILESFVKVENGSFSPKIKYTANIEEINPAADVLIDFSAPETIPSIQAWLIKNKVGAVIGTTGYSEEGLSNLREISKEIPILYSSNMSLGINFLKEILKKTVQILGSDFDFEISELHHRHKKDAPSGTALELAKIIQEYSSQEKTLIYGRQGFYPRQNNEIGIHSLRAGEIFGQHRVLIAGSDEYLEFNHTALSRKAFAKGALQAAHFIAKAKPGWYEMKDLLLPQNNL